MWLNSNRLVKSQSSTLHIQLSSLLSSLQHTDAWVPQHHLLLLPIHGGSSSFAESPQSRCWMHHHTPLPDASPRRWSAASPSRRQIPGSPTGQRAHPLLPSAGKEEGKGAGKRRGRARDTREEGNSEGDGCSVVFASEADQMPSQIKKRAR